MPENPKIQTILEKLQALLEAIIAGDLYFTTVKTVDIGRDTVYLEEERPALNIFRGPRISIPPSSGGVMAFAPYNLALKRLTVSVDILPVMGSDALKNTELLITDAWKAIGANYTFDGLAENIDNTTDDIIYIRNLMNPLERQVAGGRISFDILFSTEVFQGT